jgi:coatomer protein complex subunit alpha (xenin)
VLQLSEAQARNALTVDYDDRTPFTICAASLTPMYKGAGEVLRSPYSGAGYKPEYKGSVCLIDGLAQVGVQTIGLVVAPAAVTSGGSAQGGYGRR